MDKLSYMKAPLQRFREYIRVGKHYHQPKYNDVILKNGPSFKHSWAQLAHMHDLRVWTLAYAPGKKNHIRRL